MYVYIECIVKIITTSMEHTHDIRANTIKPVIARIHMMDNDKNVIQYIVNPMETIAYVPRKDVEGDCINDKWVTILAAQKKDGKVEEGIFKLSKQTMTYHLQFLIDLFQLRIQMISLKKCQKINMKPSVYQIVDFHELHLLLEGF